MGVQVFSVPTEVINLYGKLQIRKYRHYGGQAVWTNGVILSNSKRKRLFFVVSWRYGPYNSTVRPLSDEKGKLSRDISKFPPAQNIPIIVNYFLFSLSLLNLEELKAYKNFNQSYNQFESGWVKEVKTKLFLNYLLKMPWLLDESVRNVFPSSFYCLILIRCTVFTASTKIPESGGSISPSSFYW